MSIRILSDLDMFYRQGTRMCLAKAGIVVIINCLSNSCLLPDSFEFNIDRWLEGRVKAEVSLGVYANLYVNILCTLLWTDHFFLVPPSHLVFDRALPGGLRELMSFSSIIQSENSQTQRNRVTSIHRGSPQELRARDYAQAG